jgi:Fic family protein
MLFFEPIKCYNWLKEVTMRYNWQNPDWPNFVYDENIARTTIYQYAIATGLTKGELSHLSRDQKQDTLIEMMLDEAVHTSLIEGESFELEDIRSSLRKHLGLSSKKSVIRNKNALGIAKLMIETRETFNSDLTSQQLWRWHKLLMEHSDQSHQIIIAGWRSDSAPMQIISGHFGHEKVHFEAPPSNRVPKEMEHFIQWFNQTNKSGMPGPIRAAIAHLYFESIHPFDDGNGRIGRAICEKALSQDLGSPVILSLSKTIDKHRKEYYQELAIASRYDLTINRWIEFFVGLILESQHDAQKTIAHTIQITKFWQKYGTLLNDRQVLVMKKMLATGPNGFIGGISAKKYMRLAGCSKATATRDLQNLTAKGCIKRLPAEGRSTSYSLALPVL